MPDSAENQEAYPQTYNQKPELSHCTNRSPISAFAGVQVGATNVGPDNRAEN